MTKRKGIRTLAALALCFALCISFTVPAFAYADDTEQELPVTEATQPEATPETAAPEEPEPYEGEQSLNRMRASRLTVKATLIPAICSMTRRRISSSSQYRPRPATPSML